MAAGAGAGAGNVEHLLGAQISRLAGARRMGEGAIVADVAAQLGQRDEYFARIGHELAMRRVAQAAATRISRPRIGQSASSNAAADDSRSASALRSVVTSP